MTMSKFLGPPAGPVKALERARAPAPNTTVSSAPILFANVVLRAFGFAEVVDKSISMLLSVVENAAPLPPASGRKTIAVMRIGPRLKALDAYTCS